MDEFISRLKMAPALLAMLLSLLLAAPAAAIQPHRPAAVPALAQGDRAAAAMLLSAELFAFAARPQHGRQHPRHRPDARHDPLNSAGGSA